MGTVVAIDFDYDRRTRLVPGEYKVCGRCGFAWHARGWADECPTPSCPADCRWIQCAYFPEQAQLIADAVDADAVEAELADIARRRAAGTLGPPVLPPVQVAIAA